MAQHQPTTRSSTTRSAYAMMDIQQEDRYSGEGISQHSQETDDDDWEDEDTLKDPAKASGSHQDDNANLWGSPRRRRKPIRVVNGPRKQIPPAPRLRPELQPTAIRDAMVEGALDGTIFTGRYALDVFSAAIHLLRWPLTIFLFIWFLSLLLPLMFGYISQTVQHAFQPLCIVPGISRSPMCRVDNDLNNNTPKFVPRWADYPKLVEVQSKTFEHLLEESVGGSALSLEIKKAEMATSDLITRVRISELKAKDTISESLREFLEDAKKTGEGLHKLTAKVGGAVDRCVCCL
jgi:hypothetical protein